MNLVMQFRKVSASKYVVAWFQFLCVCNLNPFSDFLIVHCDSHTLSAKKSGSCCVVFCPLLLVLNIAFPKGMQPS